MTMEISNFFCQNEKKHGNFQRRRREITLFLVVRRQLLVVVACKIFFFTDHVLLVFFTTSLHDHFYLARAAILFLTSVILSNVQARKASHFSPFSISNFFFCSLVYLKAATNTFSLRTTYALEQQKTSLNLHTKTDAIMSMDMLPSEI